MTWSTGAFGSEYTTTSDQPAYLLLPCSTCGSAAHQAPAPCCATSEVTSAYDWKTDQVSSVAVSVRSAATVV